MRRFQAACVTSVLCAGLSASACEFSTPTRWVLKFPPINPATPRTETALLVNPASPDPGGTRVGFCASGQPMVVTVRGELRLKHESREAYLPFTLDLGESMFTSPGPAAGVPLVIHGRIDAAAARAAPPGRYVGNFVLEVTP